MFSGHFHDGWDGLVITRTQLNRELLCFSSIFRLSALKPEEEHVGPSEQVCVCVSLRHWGLTPWSFSVFALVYFSLLDPNILSNRKCHMTHTQIQFSFFLRSLFLFRSDWNKKKPRKIKHPTTFNLWFVTLGFSESFTVFLICLLLNTFTFSSSPNHLSVTAKSKTPGGGWRRGAVALCCSRPQAQTCSGLRHIAASQAAGLAARFGRAAGIS